MNKTFAALCVLSSLSVFAGQPELVGFSCVQDQDRSTVSTSFTLAGDAILTVDVKTNGVSIGWRNFRTAMTGAALNRVNPAGEYTLVWDPSNSWIQPRTIFPGGVVSVEVMAWSPDNPPDWMDVDLTSVSNVAYYVTSDELPYAVSDDVYKTTHLLMRRIHAANRVWLMGSPASESGRATKNAIETQHPVALSADYYIGVYEFTQGQYKNLGFAVPDGQSAIGDRHPLAMVTYTDFHGWWNYWWPENGHSVASGTVLDALRKRSGVQFDLPTEAQWEYVCRAGTTTAYCDGTANSTTVGDYAVYKANAPTDGNGGQTCAEVGTKNANGFGIFDMIGNVSEFCREQLSADLGADYACDPKGVVISKNAGVVMFANRGANYSKAVSSWDDGLGGNVAWLRPAARGDRYVSPSTKAATLGARLVAPASRDWPTVSVAAGTVSQDSSRRVAITYELEEDSIVTLELYEDGERVSDEALRGVCGDVNRVVINGTRCIYWQPDASWEGKTIESGHLSFRIRQWPTNDPPAYMAIDLRSPSVTNIQFYASAEAMPEPITNDIWKTDYLVMRRIPAKDVTWWMGIPTNAVGQSVEGVASDLKNSKRHRVKLSQDYYISVFELTRRQTRVFANAASSDANASEWTLPYRGARNGLRNNDGNTYGWPVAGHTVNSNGALQKFRDRFGLQFDLPTEAQWEYACRAGTDDAYHGAASQNEVAWTPGNASVIHPVGELKPNGWGLYDMLGNLCEVCLEGLDAKYGLTDEQLASNTPVTDPYGPVAVSDNDVLRGGSYSLDVTKARSGDRTTQTHKSSTWGDPGYRLVCPLPGETFADPVLPAAD